MRHTSNQPKSVEIVIATLALTMVPAIGESFKLFGMTPVGFPILAFLAAMSLRIVRLRHVPAGNLFWSLMVISLLMAIRGFQRNSIYLVLQDILPIIAGITTYLAIRIWPVDEVFAWIRNVGRYLLVVATLKLVYVIVAQPAQDWGETWVSAVYYLEDGIPRVMFKGLPPLIYMAAFAETASLLRGDRIARFALPVAIGLIVLDGSRALIFGTIGAVSLSLVIGARRSARSFFTYFLIAILLIAGFSALINNDSFRSTDNAPVGVLATVETESTSAAYRVVESLIAIEAVENTLLGNGLGATFVMVASGAPGDDGSGVYVHSFPVWVYMKGGIIALALLSVMPIYLLRKLLHHLSQATQIQSTISLQVTVGLFLLLFIMASVITNAVVTFSGGVLLGTLCALISARERQIKINNSMNSRGA